MKRTVLLILLQGFLFFIQAQVNYGGKPLPFVLTKGMDGFFFEEMPSFDVEEEIRIDSLNESDMRSGFRFAYKFITNYNPTNSGTRFTLYDGTKVWRLGIRSKGALSLNVLFTEFEIPEGARLFLYNSDQSHILGSFTSQNNKKLGMFPVSPVLGDELVIEYHEPAYVSFPGRLTIGEVNHAYRSLLGREPDITSSRWDLSCIEPTACFEDDPEITEELRRSVVLLIINGTTSCSGVMVNNTANDGKPYLLTASHCLNGNFTIMDPDHYVDMAGSIVCFFNYDSPLCRPLLRGTEEMSVSSSRCVAINEKHDMTLLELLEMPPVYYQPYYAGWNINDNPPSPFFSIHHPAGTPKRVNWVDDSIKIGTFTISLYAIEKNAHWHIEKWAAGCTAGGSSGSPLFDGEGRILGNLTGGRSSCKSPSNDYFFALSKVWEKEEDYSRQLKYWLNPGGGRALVCEGFDPYAAIKPTYRLSNIKTNGLWTEIEKTTLSNTDTIPLFGNNSVGITHFVEAYQIPGEAELFGTYLVSSAVKDSKNLDVEITVYDCINNQPGRLLHTEVFKPTYTDYESNKFTETTKQLGRTQESFVYFSTPVPVDSKFFIGYKINSIAKDAYFSVLNLVDEEQANSNTTWMYYQDKWIEAINHPINPMKTSLYIDPVLSYVNVDSNDSESVMAEKENPFFLSLNMDRTLLSVYIQDEMEKGELILVSMEGKTVKRYYLNSKQTTLTLPTNLVGVYLAKVTYGGKSFVKKIII